MVVPSRRVNVASGKRANVASGRSDVQYVPLAEQDIIEHVPLELNSQQTQSRLLNNIKWNLIMNRKPDTTSFWIGRLPHWEVEGGRYFITLRLAGAIPKAGRDEIKAKSLELANITGGSSPQWLQRQRLLFAKIEKWLDYATSNLWLTQPAVAEMIVEAITTRQDRRDWKMLEYVIMGNHLHLVCEFGSKGMKWVMEDFKRWTGHRAAKLISFENRFGNVNGLIIGRDPITRTIELLDTYETTQ